MLICIYIYICTLIFYIYILTYIYVSFQYILASTPPLPHLYPYLSHIYPTSTPPQPYINSILAPSFVVQGGHVKLHESTALVTRGTTGLRSWPGGIRLFELFADQPELVFNRLPRRLPQRLPRRLPLSRLAARIAARLACSLNRSVCNVKLCIL